MLWPRSLYRSLSGRCLQQNNTRLIVNVQPILSRKKNQTEIQREKNHKIDCMQLLSADSTMFLKKRIGHDKMKKPPSKFALHRPNFFSVLPTGLKPSQITFSVPQKCLPAGLLYNDFGFDVILDLALQTNNPSLVMHSIQ